LIVVNFTHPLTRAQYVQVEQLTGQTVQEVRQVLCQFDNAQPFAEQVSERIDAAGLSAEVWQKEPILINPPAFAPAAAVLIAELHGRMGYFPALMRLRPLPETVPTQFEVAEIISLQAVRDYARGRR
jgi:hypothetical protein